jgi:hypothetical protein
MQLGDLMMSFSNLRLTRKTYDGRRVKGSDLIMLVPAVD